MAPTRLRRLAVLLPLLIAGSDATEAAEYGTLRKDDEPPIVLTQAVTCAPRYDTTGFGKAELVVLLSDKPLETAAIRGGADCDAHAFEQAVRKGDGALVSLSFAPGPKLDRISIYGVGYTLGNGTCGDCSVKTEYAGDKVRGSVATREPLEAGRVKFKLDSRFDLARPGSPDMGTALPAGGGDPGKAFLAYVKAYQDGDFVTLERVLPPGAAQDQWGYHQDAAERASAIKQDAALEPKTAKVLEGRLLGDLALLVVEVPALWGEGQQKALVGLSKVGGGWRVDDLRRDLAGTMFAK
jgi:hypothetical protein